MALVVDYTLLIWNPVMPDKFDPYRESLIMETVTVWPEEYDEVSVAKRQRIEESLHADPEACSMLEYVRVHTGFCRTITVTEEDLERVG